MYSVVQQQATWDAQQGCDPEAAALRASWERLHHKFNNIFQCISSYFFFLTVFSTIGLLSVVCLSLCLLLWCLVSSGNYPFEGCTMPVSLPGISYHAHHGQDTTDSQRQEFLLFHPLLVNRTFWGSLASYLKHSFILSIISIFYDLYLKAKIFYIFFTCI